MVLGFARARRTVAPTEPGCVLIGPVGAGKSTLIASLRHQTDGSHSYIDRFGVEVTGADSTLPASAETAQDAGDGSGLQSAPPAPENPQRAAGDGDAFRVYESDLDHAIRGGLAFQATFTNQVFELSFRLTLRALSRSGRFRPDRTVSQVFRAVDAAGGLLLDDPLQGARDPATQGARSLLGEKLLAAENVLLCLPASGFSANPHRADGAAGAAVPPAHRRALIDLLRELREHPTARTRRLIVVLTKFEAALAGWGRRAYRAAAERATAQEVCSQCLHAYWDWLTPSLQAFDAEKGREVFVQPVSTFGFIPFNGGPNLDPRTELLRTRTPERADESRTTKTPYTYEAVHGYYWRPFLTLDPFIFVATGEPGFLTFALDEALGE